MQHSSVDTVAKVLGNTPTINAVEHPVKLGGLVLHWQRVRALFDLAIRHKHTPQYANSTSSWW